MPVYSASSRRSIRFRRYDYSQHAYYFFTLCAAGHESIFGRIRNYKMECNRAGAAVWETWRQLPPRFPVIELDAFVVMPNHLHGIRFFPPLAAAGAASSAPTKTVADAPALGLILRAFKSLSAAAVSRVLHRTGAVWQRNYYEHIVRSAKDLDAVRLYINQNPMQWLNDQENPEARPRLS
jgi:putative transposase